MARGLWSELSSSSIPSYPEELLWNGRVADNEFDSEERLYYRAKDVDERGKLAGFEVVLSPNTSVNRGKYSRPVHVLYSRLPNYLTWHVLEFFVKNIPPELEHPDRRKFQFRIAHDPVPQTEFDRENYAHAEIRAYQSSPEPLRRMPSIVDKQYRQILADFMEKVPHGRLYGDAVI